MAHIPARGGSKRVPAKNLRYLCGRPMLAYALECARRSGVFDEIYVNTDSEVIADLATASGAKTYVRPEELATDETTGDDFTADFMERIRPATLVMVSPVCPLVEPEDVRQAVEAYRGSDCDTLITCENTQMQTFCNERAVNIDPEGPLAPSQTNPIVQILNWAVTIWDTETFLRSYRERKSGYIGTKRLLLPIDPMRCLKVSKEVDFRMAESLLRVRGAAPTASDELRYWTPADGIPWRSENA
jgi:CMP-N-acetylneuraminic acid synthetase